MKGEIDQISAKIETLEINQENSHKVTAPDSRHSDTRHDDNKTVQENMATHSRLDDMAVKVKEIRQLTGVR